MPSWCDPRPSGSFLAFVTCAVAKRSALRHFRQGRAIPLPSLRTIAPKTSGDGPVEKNSQTQHHANAYSPGLPEMQRHVREQTPSPRPLPLKRAETGRPRKMA